MGSDNTTEELMNVILANEGDYVFSGWWMVKATSSKAELRKSYLFLSAKVNPDNNPGSPVSKQLSKLSSSHLRDLLTQKSLTRRRKMM